MLRWDGSTVPNKMERFTQRARRVLSSAQEAAHSLNGASIDTEHLLLGLMRENDGVAGRVLRDLGLNSRRVEDLVWQITKAEERMPNSQLDLSPGTKKALELAVDEARRLEHNYIGSEHLLLGLVRLQDGVALDILRELNVTPEQIRRQVFVVRESAPSEVPLDVPRSFRRRSQRHFDYFLLRAASRSSGGISQLSVDLSAEVKDALEEALKEVGHTGFLLLEERHLLLGLLHNSVGTVSRVLLDMGVDRDELIHKLRHPTDGA